MRSKEDKERELKESIEKLNHYIRKFNMWEDRYTNKMNVRCEQATIYLLQQELGLSLKRKYRFK